MPGVVDKVESGGRQIVPLPHELADEHTLLAQKYAGALVGYPYRNTQQRKDLTRDRRRKWKEPAVQADDCIFCVRLTDEEAVRRVLGFQFQLDVEATRTKHDHLKAWIESDSPDVPDPKPFKGTRFNQVNLRRFVELFQDMRTEKRLNGWNTRPFPIVDLPMRLKRKLCIEWNHIYTKWMEETDTQYDFEEHIFFREGTAPEMEEEEFQVWFGNIVPFG